MGFIDWARTLFGFGKVNREAVPAGTIEREFGARPAVSRSMAEHLSLWWDLYTNHPPWETSCVRPLGLPGAVGRELSRHALAEFQLSLTGGPRADYLQQQFEAVEDQLGNFLELGLCLGGVALKPYPAGDGLLVDAYTTGFLPTRFDGAGRVTGGVFKSAPLRQGGDWYVKLEYHDLLPREDGPPVYVVENKAFRSGPEGGVGAQVPLNAVAEWAGLSPREEIANLEGPLFAYFKPPRSNDVEPSSRLGVSVYAGATVDLLQQADEQWYQLRREYRTGKSKPISVPPNFRGYSCKRHIQPPMGREIPCSL